MNTQEKYIAMQQKLKELEKVIVAYSGGVDSTFLLKVSVDTLGRENVLACISAGPSLPQSQYENALQMADDMGANIETIKTDELADSAYTVNKADRCFHCKSHLYKNLLTLAKKRGYSHVACGANYDDRSDYRPGNKAAGILGVHSPLMETALTKKEIRQLSRDMNLPTADIPASPCLASRVMYGLDITDERLKQIEQAEDFLRQLGFVEFRVRHHDSVARIEVRSDELNKVLDKTVRSQITKKLKSFGFKFVALDLEGFRSGALNEALTEQEKV